MAKLSFQFPRFLGSGQLFHGVSFPVPSHEKHVTSPATQTSAQPSSEVSVVMEATGMVPVPSQ